MLIVNNSNHSAHVSEQLNMFRMMIVAFVFVCFLISTNSGSSAGNVTCESKEFCSSLWNANITDCINGTCHCTGGSIYVERDNKCECKEGYVIGFRKCLPAVSVLGAVCDEKIQCSKFGELAVCDNYQCHCGYGATSVNGKCKPKKYFGDSCESTEECKHIKRLECRDNICVCADGGVASNGSSLCLPVLKNFWSPCEDDIQCRKSFGEGSRCLTKCVCKGDYHLVNDSVCIRNKGLGEQCISDNDCYLDTDIHGETVSCQREICACKSGYRASSNNLDCSQYNGGPLSRTPMSCAAAIAIVTFVTCLKLIVQ